MKIRLLIILTFIVFILGACASTAEVLPISAPNFTPTYTQSPSSTPSPVQPTAMLQASPSILPEEVVMLTSEPPEIILTALNLQLDSNGVKLTESANQISTLATESAALKTQLADSATNAVEDSNPNPSSSQYTIPSNVYTVVTVDKAVVFETKSSNKAGAPIMLPYKPRVFLPPGTEAWVYKKQVKADGGGIFYESFDPDGQSDLKVYFRAEHIQIRLPNGRPDPDKYPSNVAKAVLIDKTVLFVVTSYDKAGKPIMNTYKPYIRYNVGSTEIVYPEYVIATGGSHWYPVYDPDGKPSGYIRSTFISFPLFWE